MKQDTDSLVSRAYNDFRIIDNLLIKKSSDTTRLANEIEYYMTVPKWFAHYFPRVFEYSICENNSPNSWMIMEYYSYDDASKLLFELKNPSPTKIQKFINHIDKFLGSARLHNNAHIRNTTKEQTRIDSRSMYVDKTKLYYYELITDFELFKEIASYPRLFINGKSYHNFEQMQEWIFKMVDFHVKEIYPAFIHGDFCLSNILFGYNENSINPKSTVKFIDPRGKFGNAIHEGDVYYDLAKLMHSTHGGYEFIIHDRFTVTQLEDSNQHWELIIPENKVVQQHFDELLFSKYDAKIIKLLQGLIFIGMCSRHYDSEDRQVAMYLQGIKILNEVMYENGFVI